MLDDVVAAVAFMSSRTLHIIEEVPGSNGAFQLVVSPTIARQYLAALAHFADTQQANAGNRTGDTDICAYSRCQNAHHDRC